VVIGRLTRALVTPSDDDDRAIASSGRPGSVYGTGTRTAATPGVPGVADSEVVVTDTETIVTGPTADAPVDPVTGQSWPAGTPATTRGGI
jgi:hypothetical protein